MVHPARLGRATVIIGLMSLLLLARSPVRVASTLASSFHLVGVVGIFCRDSSVSRRRRVVALMLISARLGCAACAKLAQPLTDAQKVYLRANIRWHQVALIRRRALLAAWLADRAGRLAPNRNSLQSSPSNIHVD